MAAPSFISGQIYRHNDGRMLKVTLVRNGKAWARQRRGPRGPYSKNAFEIGGPEIPTTAGFQLLEPVNA